MAHGSFSFSVLDDTHDTHTYSFKGRYEDMTTYVVLEPFI